jgi:hypothetical protein
MPKQQGDEVPSILHKAGGSSASSQVSPRSRHDVASDSVIVRVEASDASPVRANTQSRTFTIKN